MKTNILLFVITLTILSFNYTKAQEGTKTILDLEKAIKLALDNNYDHKIAKYNKLIADEQVTEAWGSAVFPEIKGLVNYRRALKKGVFVIDAPGFSGTFPIGTDNTLTSTLSLKQTLFSGAAFIGIRAAEVFADMQKYYVEVSESQVKYQVKEAYYLTLLSKEVVDLSLANLNRAKDNLKNTESLHKAGLVADYDLVRAKVQVQMLEPQYEEALNSLTNAENALKLATGLEIRSAIEIKDKITFIDGLVTDYDLYVSEMRRTNPVLKAQQEEINLRDAAVSVYFAQHFPTLAAFGNWNVEAQENDDRSIGDWRFNNSVTLGLELQIPIFNGWQTSAKVSQAELEHKIAQENLKKTRDILTNRLEATILKIENSRAKVKSYSEATTEAELAFSLSEKRFNSGVGTQLEVIDSQLGVTSAKFNYLSAIYEYLMAVTTLEQLLNREIYK